MTRAHMTCSRTPAADDVKRTRCATAGLELRAVRPFVVTPRLVDGRRALTAVMLAVVPVQVRYIRLKPGT